MKYLQETQIEALKSSHGRKFTFFIQGLIILSLISFSLDTLPGLSIQSKKYLDLFEIFSVIIFTIEYFFRILIAKDKLKFILSFYGLIDLIAIIPFYIASGLDLRAMRIFRLLRLFRILKLMRYNNAIERFHKAIVIVKEEIIVFSFASFILLYLSATGIYFFENVAQPEAFKSIFHSLWWAVTTLTTVGYGDIYPITIGGRILHFSC